jgi:hypothetical protein
LVIRKQDMLLEKLLPIISSSQGEVEADGSVEAAEVEASSQGRYPL